MLIVRILLLVGLIGFLILNYIRNRAVYITIISGRGIGQTRRIIDYNKVSKAIKVDKPFKPVPDGSSKYQTWRRTDEFRKRNDNDSDAVVIPD